ncbi:MAG: aldehyde dehydrogenase family protein [Anaerolineae bacterium]|nr:MAG: aldehyde dehydrogenase family protein [Anaerolineae bacterium]
MSVRDFQHFINGEWTAPAGGGMIDSIDPSTEDVIARVGRGNAHDINAAVGAARAAFPAWRDKKPKDRARLLFDLARAIEARVDEFAKWETLDSGKPLPRSRGEVLSTARYFEFYAGAADKYYGETIPLGADYIDFTLREPMGVTAHIVPWNFPMNMIGRSVAPALAMGNTAVVKPAEQTPVTAMLLAELMQELGFPAGVFNVVNGYGTEAGAPLTAHPDIDCITFTGSVETGRIIMKTAAEHIKPVVLELGGKSPNIIFADTDLDLAVAEASKGIFSNTGQVCSAGSRVLVEARVRDAFVEKLAARTNQIKVGRGMDSPEMGPLVSREQYERVEIYMGIGREEGAEVAAGGNRPPEFEKGFFWQPTILDRVTPEMRVAQEEIFGPVLAVLTFDDEAEALEIANGVKYGLVAGIFTNDINRAMRLARDLKAGQVYVNEYFAGGEETPFGGYKQSGFGREKGLEALINYTQVKNVAIRIR